MARIAVVSSHPPFSEGGHLVIARSLVRALQEAGHEAEIVYTPQNRYGRQGAAYLANWLTDVGESMGQPIDQAISLRFPAYAVRHPRHVCWLCHTMREYYDLWPRPILGVGMKGKLKEHIRRRLIHAADRHFLGPRHLRKFFVISQTVSDRIRNAIGVPSEALYPPPPPRPYRCDLYGDFIFAVSRITPLKRLDLLVRALAEPSARGVRAVIAGDGDDLERLRHLARDLGVADRVSFPGRIDDEAMLALYATCRAVCFTPRQEDYGFITAEAFMSQKPVVSCVDSGGPAELIEHGVSGLLCEPTPANVADGLRAMMEDAAMAERMGHAGAARAACLTWPAVVERLVLR
jgi:glycosyltransferase involved in cell wall biosynthesis